MEDRTLLQNLRQTPNISLPMLIISKLLAIALPIAQVVIGVNGLQKCPAQPLIPVYLVVSGVFALILTLLSCLPCTKEGENGSGPFGTLCTTWNSFVTLFLFLWFLAGNVWIYSIYQPNYDPTSILYCDKVLYLFAFWTLTLVYVFIGVLMLVGCCIMFCMCVCGRAGITDVSQNEV